MVTDASKEHIASIFLVEVSRVGKVAGYVFGGWGGSLRIGVNASAKRC
jgi:hypothetical protein